MSKISHPGKRSPFVIKKEKNGVTVHCIKVRSPKKKNEKS